MKYAKIIIIKAIEFYTHANKSKENSFLWYSMAYKFAHVYDVSVSAFPFHSTFAALHAIFERPSCSVCTNVLTSFTPDIFIVATDFQVWLNYTIRIKCFSRARALDTGTFEFDEGKKIVTDTWFSLQFYFILFFSSRSFISTSARPWTNECASECFRVNDSICEFSIFEWRDGEKEGARRIWGWWSGCEWS